MFARSAQGIAHARPLCNLTRSARGVWPGLSRWAARTPRTRWQFQNSQTEKTQIRKLLVQSFPVPNGHSCALPQLPTSRSSPPSGVTTGHRRSEPPRLRHSSFPRSCLLLNRIQLTPGLPTQTGASNSHPATSTAGPIPLFGHPSACPQSFGRCDRNCDSQCTSRRHFAKRVRIVKHQFGQEILLRRAPLEIFRGLGSGSPAPLLSAGLLYTLAVYEFADFCRESAAFADGRRSPSRCGGAVVHNVARRPATPVKLLASSAESFGTESFRPRDRHAPPGAIGAAPVRWPVPPPEWPRRIDCPRQPWRR